MAGHRIETRIACGLLLGACFAAASAQMPLRVDAGKLEYDAHCASCHGPAGAGNGELRRFLTVPPSDLSTLARRNGGVFPNQLVWEVIDGRSTIEIGPHGPRTMPVWGQRFRQEALQHPATAAEPEWTVRNRIVALLDYLSRLQQK